MKWFLNYFIIKSRWITFKYTSIQSYWYNYFPPLAHFTTWFAPSPINFHEKICIHWCSSRHSNKASLHWFHCNILYAECCPSLIFNSLASIRLSPFSVFKCKSEQFVREYSIHKNCVGDISLHLLICSKILKKKGKITYALQWDPLFEFFKIGTKILSARFHLTYSSMNYPTPTY